MKRTFELVGVVAVTFSLVAGACASSASGQQGSGWAATIGYGTDLVTKAGEPGRDELPLLTGNFPAPVETLNEALRASSVEMWEAASGQRWSAANSRPVWSEGQALPILSGPAITDSVPICEIPGAEEPVSSSYLLMAQERIFRDGFTHRGGSLSSRTSMYYGSVTDDICLGWRNLNLGF